MKKIVMCLAAAVVYAVIVIASSIMLSENPQMDVIANYAVIHFFGRGTFGTTLVE